MLDKLSELYFNFWDKFGIGADISLIFFFFLVTYFVIKNAVANGILSAYEELSKEKHRLSFVDKFTQNKKSEDDSMSE